VINSPIKYSTESEDLIRKVKARCGGTLTPELWNSDELEPVRAEIKNYYKIEQDYRCSYCWQKILVKHSATWDTEHVVPRSRHPQFIFEPTNLCIACKDCNLAKGDVEVLVNKTRKTYPKKSDDFKIVHPHFDEHEEHISIHIGHIYKPKSDKGKFTIIHCNLLRFSYGHFGYDPNLASKPKLVEKITEFVSEADESRQEDLLQTILLIAQIHVSKSVLD
jgi:5-methylcytosine-specific restriction endonuclease McrA